MLGFSWEEEKVFTDLDYFRYRDTIEAKLEVFFSGIQDQLQRVVRRYQPWLPAELQEVNGKYSRGERHLGAPYRVLDCPNLLRTDTFVAFRCCLLWGRSWGAHLLLGGAAAEPLRRGIVHHLQYELHANCWISRAETPWGWTVGEDRAVPSFDLSPAEISSLDSGRPFLKLSRYWPLADATPYHTKAPEWLDQLLRSATFWLG